MLIDRVGVVSALLFFFNDTAITEIYTLSLHVALPISNGADCPALGLECGGMGTKLFRDRKSTRLNCSHLVISYAVFCLKKKKGRHTRQQAARPRGLFDQPIGCPRGP